MATYFGVYRARITNVMDPTAAGRVQVIVPAIGGAQSQWAPVANSFGAVKATPQVGATVWVAFEAGDARYPVVLGTSPG